MSDLLEAAKAALEWFGAGLVGSPLDFPEKQVDFPEQTLRSAIAKAESAAPANPALYECGDSECDCHGEGPLHGIDLAEDPADIIAGELQCSRGYAYELMRKAIAESGYDAQKQALQDLADSTKECGLDY